MMIIVEQETHTERERERENQPGLVFRFTFVNQKSLVLMQN